jgi:RNA polymerase sigma-70 factor (ECF subfamily)
MFSASLAFGESADTIREAQIPFEIPSGAELTRRLNGVLQSLYLLFNEGYKASSGEKLVREDICYEAIRLTGLLAAHPSGNRPATHALLSLMLFNSARIPTRVDGAGNLLLLEEQDRARWDRRLMAKALFSFCSVRGGRRNHQLPPSGGHSRMPLYS